MVHGILLIAKKLHSGFGDECLQLARTDRRGVALCLDGLKPRVAPRDAVDEVDLVFEPRGSFVRDGVRSNVELPPLPGAKTWTRRRGAKPVRSQPRSDDFYSDDAALIGAREKLRRILDNSGRRAWYRSLACR